MPPRRRGRDRGMFQESGGQNEDQSSAPSRTRPQHAQVNAFTREQAEETPSRVIGGGTVASSRGNNLRWGVPVVWYTSHRVPVTEYQSQCTSHRVPVEEYQSQGMYQSQGESRAFKIATLLATRAWLRPVSRGNRNFTVDCGRLRQSGPRPETGFIRQLALEGLTRLARTDSPRQVGRNNFRAKRGGGAGGARGRRRRRLMERRGGRRP
ncbi:sucrose transporter-like [Dorcoceras hygrometricum]|uniref:Sucrose transporter-like n=1 Tax=Dorcoceras hygrometricum TaxID=472368 RepID=A0A2Z7CNL6_9LAMI|nr:sucrose transporter-like [Dorcoceras hygrometricum]